MSRLKQLILTLCALSCVFALYYFHPYFTLLLTILTVVVYLYIDYENHQPRHHQVNSRSSFFGNYLNAFRLWAVTYIPNEHQIHILNKPNHQTPRPNMPSITPYAVNSRRPSALTGTSSFLVSPNLNENRLRSSANFNSLNSSSNAFNALSPIRRNNNNSRASTSHEFNNLSISGTRSPYQTPNQQIASPSYVLNSSRDSSLKQPHTGSAPRHVQAFAGPLLASTRYNLSSDSPLFADVNSPGFSSRIARYGSDSLSSNRSITHQAQYSGPGQFPIVHLGKASKLPVLSGRNSQKLAKTPVRVRMAPPESSERSAYSLSDRSQILSGFSPSMSSPKSVLDTLHEMSRKRLHAQLGDVDDEAAKKQRKSAADDWSSQKRGRDEAAFDVDDQTKKKTKSNEILSSLSSSRNLVNAAAAERSSVKRKTSPGDVLNGSTRTPTGKVLKTSVPSPEIPTAHTDQRETAVQTELPQEPVCSRFTPQPITPTQPMEDTLADATYRKTIMRGEMHGDWLRRGFVHPSEDLKLNVIKDKREEDAKSRLKSMMSVIGGRDGGISQDLHFDTVSQPSAIPTMVSAPTSVPPQLPAMFTTKPPEKHVHFAETLTQVKMFDNTSSESTPSFGSDSLVKSTAVVETLLDTNNTAVMIPSAQVPVLEGFKMPSTGAPVSFGLPKQSNFSSTQGTPDTVTNFGALPQATATETSKTAITEATKTSGFSFGSATSIPSTVTFGQTGMPSLGQSITTATPSSTVLGQISSPVIVKTSSVPSTFGQIATTLGGATAGQTISPTISTTFGQTATNVVTPTFGQQTVATSTYGQSPAMSTFGESASFGITTPSPSLFGSVTSTFGSSTTTAASTLATTASPKPSFGSTFGSSSAVSTGFGSASPSLTTSGSTFGSSIAQSTTTFGSPASTNAPTFGSATSGSAFGSSVPTSTSTGSVFGSSAPTSTTTGSVFGSSAPTLTSTISQEGGFGLTSSKPETPKLFGFGGVTSPQANIFAPQTKPSGFGTPSQNPPPPYGSVTANTTQGAFAFGGSSNTSGVIGSSPMFGAKTEQQMTTPTFGSSIKSSAFQFNATPSAADSSQGGGGFKFDLAQTTKPNPTPSLFGGFSATSTDAKPATTQGTFAFGSTAPAKPFAFGDSKTTPTLFGNTVPSPISSIQTPSSGFGQNVFGSQTQQQSGVNVSNLTQIPTQQQKPAGIFSFGSAPTPAPVATQSGGFSFGSTAKPGGFAFGSAATQAPTPTFGQAAQPTSSFGQTSQPSPSFGQTIQTTPSFGQAAQATPSFGQAAQATPSFGQTAQAAPSFGQPVQPTSSGGAFQFGSAPTVPTGGFNFGGGGSNAATSSFGGAPTNNAFQMGGAPQFGGMQPQQAPGMFSIGTGSSAPRGRLARSRRPR